MEETVFTIVLVIAVWLLYLLAAVPLSLAIWYFGRKRVEFRWWELSVLILPFAVWLGVSTWSSSGKGLGNFILEPLLLGGAVPIAAVIRVIVGGAINPKLTACTLMFVICALATLLGIEFPEIKFQPFVK